MEFEKHACIELRRSTLFIENETNPFGPVGTSCVGPEVNRLVILIL